MIFETYQDFGSYAIGNMTQSEPSCFNGVVRVIKYRVTIEEIKEDDSVMRDRIQGLWDKCDNHHNRPPLIGMAEKYGLKLGFNKG